MENRRFDIDWIRVVAIGLLMIYHVAIGFQPWGVMVGFITSSTPWLSLWTPMAMINMWRIPLLFFVSGMGVYFALQNRTMLQLLAERTRRIFLPFVFGIFCVVPIHLYLRSYYYNMNPGYVADPGHLWFLGNIMIYVLLFAPLFYFIKRQDGNRWVSSLKKLVSTPVGLVVVVLAFVAEAEWLDPKPFELYAMTPHGFLLGMMAFFFGFLFVLSGNSFMQMLVRWRWVFLAIALSLFLYRINFTPMSSPSYRLAIESCMGVFAVLAFGNRYLNRSSDTLRYLSQAAYPVYILHMIFLYAGSILIFPLAIPVQLQFVLLLIFTVTGCMLTYEGIRRVRLLCPLFGITHRDGIPSGKSVSEPVGVQG